MLSPVAENWTGWSLTASANWTNCPAVFLVVKIIIVGDEVLVPHYFFNKRTSASEETFQNAGQRALVLVSGCISLDVWYSTCWMNVTPRGHQFDKINLSLLVCSPPECTKSRAPFAVFHQTPAGTTDSRWQMQHHTEKSLALRWGSTSLDLRPTDGNMHPSRRKRQRARHRCRMVSGVRPRARKFSVDIDDIFWRKITVCWGRMINSIK